MVSGDYKLENDGTCQAFEPVPCQTFVTESTFGLPIYHWRPQADVFGEIHDWWRENQARTRTSVVFCYALGKAQRLLHGLSADCGPIILHGTIERYLPAYRAAGVVFPQTTMADSETVKLAAGRSLVLAPVSAMNSPWLRRFGDISTGFASGWMQIRGTRRRRSLDRGFVLSDHADWQGILSTIEMTGAETVWVTHGYTHPLARWLRERGQKAEALETVWKNCRRKRLCRRRAGPHETLHGIILRTGPHHPHQRKGGGPQALFFPGASGGRGLGVAISLRTKLRRVVSTKRLSQWLAAKSDCRSG